MGDNIKTTLWEISTKNENQAQLARDMMDSHEAASRLFVL
jgi:hypothetical protein